MRSATVILLTLIFFLANSCSEEDTVDPVPKITLKEAAPLVVAQFTDSIDIVILYEDGDGDLGFSNPDSFALAILDTRLSSPDHYYVPPLTPNNESLSIQGETRIVIRNTFLLGNGDTETTRYELKIKDRAGNWSNTVTTPVITITK